MSEWCREYDTSTPGRVLRFLDAWCQRRGDARIEEDTLFEAHLGYCVLNNLLPLTMEAFFESLNDSSTYFERRSGYVLGLEVQRTFTDWIASEVYDTRLERERREPRSMLREP